MDGRPIAGISIIRPVAGLCDILALTPSNHPMGFCVEVR
jgi:hypothetical protein